MSAPLNNAVQWSHVTDVVQSPIGTLIRFVVPCSTGFEERLDYTIALKARRWTV